MKEERKKERERDRLIDLLSTVKILSALCKRHIGCCDSITRERKKREKKIPRFNIVNIIAGLYGNEQHTF